MSNPLTELKSELLAAAERQQGQATLGAGVAPNRRRWLERSHMASRRRVFALAAVALVAVATASAFAVRAFVPDKAIVGLPPVGATPSSPERGVLETFYWVHDIDRTRSRTWVYADGRLIRLGARRANGRARRGFIEQRLTREGVKLLRSEIVSAGGFGHAQPPSGSESLPAMSGPAGAPPTIQVRRRDRLAPLTWASDLERLEARLTDPESWLPASAWKQRKVRAYVPSRFSVCAAAVVVPDLDKPRQARNVQMMGTARIVALLPEAAQSALRGRDWTRGCFEVTTNEARSLAKALDGAGPATATKGGAINLHYAFDAPGPSRQVWISVGPLLPHGEGTCSQCG
jgi:hypothetical protein